MAVKIGQILADVGQINKTINRSQQGVLWDVIHQREPIKRAACASCFAAIIVRSPVSTSKWNQSIYLK